MMKRRLKEGILFVAALFIALPAWAAHPLITDDTGTQGKGKFQLEVNGQYDRDEEDLGKASVRFTGFETAVTLSYGITDNVDLVLSLPYLWKREKKDGSLVDKENGIGDASIETKMRLWEKNGFSVALKPGISFPTGDEDKGLGTGKLGGHIFLIASQEIGAWAFHANVGYIRNENDADERKDLWHASAAATWEVVKNLKLAADIGAERNPDDEADDDPAFLIGGIIYSINDNLDVDLGAKIGLTDSEADFSALAGVTFRF